MKFPFFKRTQEVKPAAKVITGESLRKPLASPLIPDGVMRKAFVDAYKELAEMKRSYDAAITTNYNADFRSTYGSANAEILTSLYIARGRARTIQKDTSHGSAVFRTYADNIVGDDPFELEMEAGTETKDGGFKEDDRNPVVEKGWKKYCRKENFCTNKQMSFAEVMRITAMSEKRDGSLIMRMKSAYPYNEFGFAVKIQESDRLQESYMGKSPADAPDGGGNPIRFSIELHPEYEFPLAYWILTRHPGDVFAYTGPKPNVWRERVPADEIIHWNNLRNRAEQDIGMTEIDAAMQPLWRIHQYEKSLTLCAIACCQRPFILTKEIPTGIQMPTDLMNDLFPDWSGGAAGPGGTAAQVGAVTEPGFVGAIGGNNPSDTQQGIGNRMARTGPASERELNWGVKASILEPEFPHEAGHNFRLDNARDIAVSTGNSYQDITGDHQNLGFIAGLMSQHPKQRYAKICQNGMIEDLRMLFRKWLTAAISFGYFDKQGINIKISEVEYFVDGAKFKPQEFEFVNPLVEAQALIILAEAGHMTRQQVQDRLPRGIKYEKLVQILKQEGKLMTAAGLPFGQEDVTLPVTNKGEPGQTDPTESQPPAKQKKKLPQSRVSMEALTSMSMNGH